MKHHSFSGHPAYGSERHAHDLRHWIAVIVVAGAAFAVALLGLPRAAHGSSDRASVEAPLSVTSS